MSVFLRRLFTNLQCNSRWGGPQRRLAPLLDDQLSTPGLNPLSAPSGSTTTRVFVFGTIGLDFLS